MRAPPALAGLAALVLAQTAIAGPRVMSLDQCADQYVLALSPRADIVGLSRRARGGDSYLAAAAAGLTERRATLESALAARPQVVVRYWGGEARMTSELERRGVRVLTIDDADDFAGVRANIRRVAAGLGQAARGEALIAEMDGKLAEAAGAGEGRAVFYLTSGGDTVGSGALVDAMIRAAGFRNFTRRPGYGAVSLEALALHPPALVALGFYDQDLAAGERWSVGRLAVSRTLIGKADIISLPGTVLGCPGWFAADAAVDLAAWARAHPQGR